MGTISSRTVKSGPAGARGDGSPEDVHAAEERTQISKIKEMRDPRSRDVFMGLVFVLVCSLFGPGLSADMRVQS
jgi:hypothetical protein